MTNTELKQMYLDLKASKSVYQVEVISQLTNEDLIDILRFHEENSSRGYKFDTLQNKLRSEIFKRNGFGKATGKHLSFRQRDFLESLNLYEKKTLRPKINVEASQKVCLSQDSEKEINQSVTINFDDNWLCFENDGNEISLSVENWHNLKRLIDKALS